MSTVVESVAGVTGGWRHGRSARKLADAAASLALRRAGIDASEVDLLVNAGIYHDRNLGEPALAALIQEDIGANPEDPHAGGHGTFSFDVANGACGMLTGLQVADGFLRAGTIGRALVVASDADPGRRLAPGFPYAPAAAALVCGWRPGPAGLEAITFARRGPDEPGGGAEDGRATVGFSRGRNTLTIERPPGAEADAGAFAGTVAAALLADHGIGTGEVDLVVANPVDPVLLDALAASSGLDRAAFVDPRAARRVHTAALGLALDRSAGVEGLAGRTVLLVSAGAGPVAGAALLRQ
jgi:3-oxoacyl-[acyl-carrier-protein] synthase-3